MQINLKRYQETAVDQLVAKVKEFLAREGDGEVCVFQAPTGSGKTVMAAKFIEELIKELPDEDLCFLWVSIGKGDLHLQSKYSLQRIFDGFPSVVLVEEEFGSGRDRIARNEVVVANWEKLRTKDKSGEWKNLLMKEGERLNFRDVLDKTNELCKIILIIDESHTSAATERAQELRDLIAADVVIEMSATPRLKPNLLDFARGAASAVLVESKDVIEEGMIRKELFINEGIAKIAESETDSQEVVLEATYQKRLELKKAFEQVDSHVNPLVLVQIPTAEAGEAKLRAVRDFLAAKKITEKNGKLAIWLAEQKSETIDWISESDNEIEFLVFKQAIDTGWDCPRAQILVKFRESRSETFEIQTVGRILRMPEQKHYADESLNRGYIYTNVQSILVKKEEYNPNIIKHLRAERIKDYRPIRVKSYYKLRADYGDATSSFTPVFEKTANSYFGLKGDHTLTTQIEKKLTEKGIKLDLRQFEQDVIADTKVQAESFDQLQGKIAPEALAKLTIAANDLQAMFEQAIKQNLGPFKNVKRSIPAVKTAIYAWFRKQLGSKDWREETLLIQKVFLHIKNRAVFEHILTRAVESYKIVKDQEVHRRIEASEQVYDFELPAELFYNEYTDERVEIKRCAYGPCYLNADRSNPEKSFEEFLQDNAAKIIWWWKNGENKQDYFGIKYEYAGAIATFYPDYLVQFQDGRLGFFEVKDDDDRDGGTLTKVKAEVFQDWLARQKRKDIFGGIAIEHNRAWALNSQKIYDWAKCKRGDWGEWGALNPQI